MKTTERYTKKQLTTMTVLRWICYFILMALSYVLQCTGTGSGALWTIPAAIMIAMNEGEITAAAVGAVSGLLIDHACGKLLGASGSLMLCCCVLASLLFTHLLRPNFLNVIFLTAFSSFLITLFDYFFSYFMWNYEDAELVLLQIELPSTLWTIFAACILYLPFKAIKLKLLPSYAQLMKHSEF